MSSIVVFILFIICLLIAIPVSISLGIVSVLPGAFDPSFTARHLCNSFYVGRIGQFPTSCGSHVRALRYHHGPGRNLEETV